MLSKVNVSKIEKARGYYEYLGWLGALLVVFGYYLNAHHCLSSWLVWLIGNLCVAGYSAHKKAWPTLAMSIVIAIMNVYGYLHWS